MQLRTPTLQALEAIELPPLALAMFHATGRVPLTARLAAQAHLDPSGTAIVDLSADGAMRTLTWIEFDRSVNRLARCLAARGAHAYSTVAIALPNGSRHVIATHAAWRVGATVVPVDPYLPPEPRSTVLQQLAPDFVVGCWEEANVTSEDVDACGWSDGPLPLRLADPYAVLHTGGSTRTPALVARGGSAWGRFDEPPAHLLEGHGIRVGQTQLVVLPLSHGFGFGYANLFGLAYGHSLVVMERFDAAGALKAVEQFGVQYLAVVPTAMRRMLHDESFERRDLSTLDALLHSAGPCPPDVKRAWMSRLGPAHIYEAYGATDISLTCTIRGDEWLRRPGSVGRPVGAKIEILDRLGRPCRDGEVGEIHVRSLYREAGHPRVLGSADKEADGLRATGDRGHRDADGYLYLQGRADLVINTGGINVSPEPIEAVLLSHPGVEDAAVVGRADDDLGATVHALVQPKTDDAPMAPELLEWCRARLPREHMPRSVALVASIPRTAVGKLRRVDLPAVERVG